MPCAPESDDVTDDGLWDSLRAIFAEEAIVEIVILCGFYRTVSALTNVMQLAPEAIAVHFPTPLPLPATSSGERDDGAR